MTLITVFTCDDAGDADVTETGGMSQSPVLWSRLADSLVFSRCLGPRLSRALGSGTKQFMAREPGQWALCAQHTCLSSKL